MDDGTLQPLADKSGQPPRTREAAADHCVRCGAAYEPWGQCSRHAEGCQGERGENLAAMAREAIAREAPPAETWTEDELRAAPADQCAAISPHSGTRCQLAAGHPGRHWAPGFGLYPVRVEAGPAPQTAAQVERKLRQDAFLRVLARLGNISAAAKAVAMSRENHYDWLADDPTYRERYNAAMVQAGAVLEENAFQRAIDGWLEPVYHEGRVAGHILRYDNRLLMDLLRGSMPEKYRERRDLQLNGNVNIKRLIGVSEDEI